jgi:saccharopine dehydrogenase-like NADP-dependent oxidoreductase
MKVLLLGVGTQGKAALYDLVNSPQVSSIFAADLDASGLKDYVAKLKTTKVTPVCLDAGDHDQVSQLMAASQVVILLLPPDFRLEMAKLAVKNGIHFIDTSYALPEYAALEDEAVRKDVALLPEFGLDPGIDLVLAGRLIHELDEVHELHAYGTGVPAPSAADNPLKYKISWTFSGVLDSYQRSARILKDGQVLDLSPSDIFDKANIHRLDVEDLGLMEAYPNGDAVRYLKIFDIETSTRNAGRYSLRWPGHAVFWKKMVDLGFLGEDPIQVGGSSVVPQQFVHDLLEPQLQYAPGEIDVAAVRIDGSGLRNGKPARIIYQMVDRRDLNTGFLAMQRTVGFTASIGAQMIISGDIHKRGLLMPGVDIPAGRFIAELGRRGIKIQRWEIDLE